MPNINNPHDLLFKETLSHKENAVSFLGNYLPEEILQIIDLETIEVEKDSFVTDELREFFTDLLYKTRIKGHEGYIYILFEHKSHPEKLITLQLLQYLLQCWKTKVKQKEKLPVIIPLVIYHGQEEWWAGLNLTQIIDIPDERLLKYIPDFEYILYELAGLEPDAIKGRRNLKAMMQLLRLSGNINELYRNLAEILELLKTDGKIDYEFFKTVTLYILSVSEIEVNDYAKLAREILSEEGGELAMTTAQKLFREGEIQGEIRGIEGMLDIKFGQAGLNLVDKIKTIEDLEKLTEIKTTIKKANSIEEIARVLQ